MTVEFGQRVKAYMERGDLSQRKLARKIHIRRSTISSVLSGDLNLSPNNLDRFEKGLNISSSEKIEFSLSSLGLTNAQIESKTGKPMRDLNEIRHSRRKLFDSKGRQFGVIRY